MRAHVPDEGRAQPHGAYGLRVEGLEGAEDLLLSVAEDWPLLTIRWIQEAAAGDGDDAEATATVSFSDGVAVARHGSSGTIEVEREPAVATFRIPRVRDPRALVHPYLGAAASIMARWLGREAFHAGAFMHAGAAWAVLGARTVGKSSLLGWLHARATRILADDVVVVDRGVAYAAPRSLDLREESAERLQLGEPLGRVGARDRWRVKLESVPSELPVAGFVFLSWSERLEVTTVLGRERLTRLATGLTIPGQPANASELIKLATLPCLELRRPRDWNALDAAGEALLAGLPD
jgi:hypothetical protein